MALTPREKLELIKKKKAIENQLIQMNQPKSVVEEYDTSGVSPVGIGERTSMQFGNLPGQLEYLQSRGYEPRVRGGDIYVKTKEGKLAPIDPLSFQDIPSDIMEFGAAIPEMAISTVPSVLGGYLGRGAGVPGAIAGTVAGGAVGGGLAEMFRQAVGKTAGTYKPEPGEGLINPEVKTSAGISALAELLLPGMAMGGKAALKRMAKPAQSLAENMYLHATGLGRFVGLQKGGIKSEEARRVAREAMEQGMIGSPETIKGMAESGLEATEEQLQEALKKSGAKISYPELQQRALSKIKSSLTPGSEDVETAKLLNVLESPSVAGKFTPGRTLVPGNLDVDRLVSEFDPDLMRALYEKEYPSGAIPLSETDISKQVIELPSGTFTPQQAAGIVEQAKQTPQEIVQAAYEKQFPWQMREGLKTRGTKLAEGPTSAAVEKKGLKNISLDLFRGSRGVKTDAGDFGKGTYYTGDEEIATAYSKPPLGQSGKVGKVTKETVTFKNPLVFDSVSSARDWRKKIVGEELLDNPQSETAANMIDAELRKLKHDGVIVFDKNFERTSLKNTPVEVVKLADAPKQTRDVKFFGATGAVKAPTQKQWQKSAIEQLQKEIAQGTKEVSEKGIAGTATVTPPVDYPTFVAQKLSQYKGDLTKHKESLNQWVDTLDIDLQSANKLKRSFNPFYKELGKDNPDVKKAMMSTQSALRDLIEEKAGDPEMIKAINKSMNTYQQILRGLDKEAAVETKRPVMSRTKGIVGSVDPKALIGYFMMDLLPGTTIETYGAKALSGAAKRAAKIKPTQTPLAEIMSQILQQGAREGLHDVYDTQNIPEKFLGY